MFPDLSATFWNEWLGDGADDIRRLFYVAFTRAREELVLLLGATERKVSWRVL